jgi:tetratricopeptide (TPR) repeat protein
MLALACPLAAAAPAAEPALVWQNLLFGGIGAASRKDYRRSEELLLKAVQLASQFPAGDPRTGATFNTLGLVYREEKKNGNAEKAFEKALVILEKAYGPNSLDVGNVNLNIASVLMADGHYDNALPYIQKSRAVYEKILGAESLKSASTYCMAGIVYRNLKNFSEAEAPLKQCADMREASGGVENPELAEALYNLALVYEHQGKYALADPRLKMAEKIRELTSGIASPEFAEVLEAHAALLRLMGRDADAGKDDALAASVRRAGKKSK